MENIKGWQIALFILVGVVVGALFTLGITQPWVTSKLIPRQPVELNSDLRLKLEKQLKEPTPGVENLVISTPKSAVTKQYHDVLNAIIKFPETIKAINISLIPLLENIDKKNTIGEYEGIVDLVIQARGLNNNQRKALDDLRSQLDHLRSANQVTSDVGIQSATTVLLNAGEKLHEGLMVYVTILDKLLGGASLNAKITQDLDITTKQVLKASDDFSVALKDLLAKIAENIKAQTPEKPVK